MFTHEKLDAYQSAIRFFSGVHEQTRRWPKAHFELIDQIRRAALSLVLNLAEGAGEFSPAEKRRFYRMSLRSGNECAAVLDVARIMNLLDPPSLDPLRAELDRTVAMLTRLATR